MSDVVLSFFIPVNSQQRHLRAAQRHIDLIAPVIHADSRFHKVELRTYTAEDGSLGIFGTVATDSDLSDLKRVIDGMNPPVNTYFSVATDEQIENFTRQTK